MQMGSPKFGFARRWVNWWLPPDIEDALRNQRARHAVAMSSVGLVFAVAVGLARLAVGNPMLALPAGVFGVAVLTSLGLTRLGAVNFAIKFILGVTFLLAQLVHWSVPSLATPMVLMCALPIFGVALMGFRQGIMLGALSAVSMSVLSFFQAYSPNISVRADLTFVSNTALAPLALLAATLVAAMIERGRVQAREALIEVTATARLATAAKSRFLAHMSHEIRTPMNGVLGLADLLLDTELNVDQLGMTSTLRQSAGALLHVIDQILDFSKVEAGYVTLQAAPYSPQAVSRQVVALLANRAAQRGVSLTLDWHDTADIQWLIGDAERLRQVLVNLVGNALKFTHEGSVTLTGRLEGTGTGARLSVAVIDTGIGISRADLTVLFEEFRQAQTESNRRYGGTGLGLAISSRLVELMGSKIEVASALGHGSTFEFAIEAETGTSPVLAVVDPPGQSRVADSTTPAPYVTNRRILVVDDNPINRMVLGRMLERLDLEVVETSSAPEALQVLAKDRAFDCVMLDCQMPIVDGFEFARRVRSTEYSEGLPAMCLIAVTASVMAEDRRRCKNAGMEGFLAKPLRRDDVRDALLEWTRLDL